MTDLQATLDAIDEVAVHECGHCSKPLREDGPSRDFCNETCQTAWLGNKRRVDQLIGYREPVDLMYGHAPAPPLSQPPRRPQSRVGAVPDYHAIERFHSGEWLALFAAPWHPRPQPVRAEYGRPPLTLCQIRMPEIRIWTVDEPDMDVAFTQDTYRLESVNEHDRSAIYRIQGLPGPRHAVFRYADGRPPTWWMQGGWEGRWIEVEDGARGHRWGMPAGEVITAVPTERYETSEDGAVAEVWEASPGHGSRDPSEEAYRAEMYRWRLQEQLRRDARIQALDPQAFLRITGV